MSPSDATRSSKTRAGDSEEVQDLLDRARRVAEFDAEAATRLYVAEESARGMQDYLQRGRQHERLAADVLKLRLLEKFRAWAENPRGRGKSAAVQDLFSEYEIRGLEFPEEETARYLEVVTQTAKAIFATRDDEKKRELGEAIMDCWESAPTGQQ
jgi:hypothetical protein